MAWRLALSLETLRNEVNAQWPNRSKASDGTIGDTAHAATASDHNPNPQGVVCAFDITQDPATGPDCDHLFAELVARHHPDCKYLIWNRQIVRAYDKPGIPAWTAAPYTGADPHTNHIHVSVGVGSDGQSAPGTYDHDTPWLGVTPLSPDVVTPTVSTSEEDTVTYTYVQKAGDGTVYVARHGEPPAHVGDKSFGFADAEALAAYQGDRIVASTQGSDVTDAQGQTRKVLTLNSVESQQWFGLG